MIRIGDTVHRTAHAWSPQVNSFLRQLSETGFDGAPYPLGTDEDGRDVFTYLPGKVGHYPWTPAVSSVEALVSAARLLRRFHDATTELAGRERAGWRWPPKEPVEVICHNDFAPYNCVFDGDRAYAMIDFDTASPGPRAWDLAYALYRFAPFTRPRTDGPQYSAEVQGHRARAFFDAYGADRALRVETLAQVGPRLATLTRFMRASAADGDQNFVRHIAEGHLDLYLADIDYISDHIVQWTAQAGPDSPPTAESAP